MFANLYCREANGMWKIAVNVSMTETHLRTLGFE
jgi:hypothetical protein